MSAAIDPLFQPITIRNLTLKNRLVMSPMTRSMSPDGALPDIAAEYYGRRADHDIGLIVTEGIGVDHPSAIGDSGTGSFDIPDLHGDKPLEDWKAVVDRVHQAGSAIFPQLWHHGVMRLDYTGREAHAPSIRPSGVWGPDTPGPFHLPQYLERAVKPTKPATEEEIADVIAGYARSARNAVSIGFDGVAIHGAHGYLPDAFLWHVTNRRTDRWGGPTLRDRASFAVELIKAVRKRHQAELDFRTEAANLRECSKNMRRRGFEPRLVRLPRVVDVSHQRCCWHLGLHSSQDGKRYRC